MNSSLQFDLFDDSVNEILSQKSYDNFSKRLAESDCQRCSLSKSRTHIVVDRGNPESGILVIGEAPGENEDIQAQAFVGKAGKLFDKIMASIGLDTNRDMLICNVVKCRPPENRTPRPEEVSACRPFLLRQIELVRPRVILLLGATALKHMDPSKKNFSMEKEAGNFFQLENLPDISLLVWYHPAALLYNSKLKPAMWEHAKKLKRFLARGREPA